MKKYMKRELPFPLLLLIGAGVMIGAVAVCALIFAAFSSLSPDPTSLTGALSLSALLIAGAVASFALTRIFKSGAPLAIISAAIAGALMCVVGLIIGGGSVSYGVFLNYLAFVCVSALFSILATKTGGKRRRYR